MAQRAVGEEFREKKKQQKNQYAEKRNKIE